MTARLDERQPYPARRPNAADPCVQRVARLTAPRLRRMGWSGWLSSPRRRERLLHWSVALGVGTVAGAGIWLYLASRAPDFPTEPVSSVRLTDDSPEQVNGPNSDLEAVTVRRTRTDLRAVLRYASQLNLHRMASAKVELEDPKGLRWEIGWARHREDGHWNVERYVTWDDGDAQHLRQCRRLSITPDPAGETVELRVGIGCLTPPRDLPGQADPGTPPEWLRLESVTVTGPLSTDMNIFGAYEDRPVLIAG